MYSYNTHSYNKNKKNDKNNFIGSRSDNRYTYIYIYE